VILVIFLMAMNAVLNHKNHHQKITVRTVAFSRAKRQLTNQPITKKRGRLFGFVPKDTSLGPPESLMNLTSRP
jgi:hypothetical protein